MSMSVVDKTKRYLMALVAGSMQRHAAGSQNGFISDSDAELADDEWKLAEDMVRQHRLGPLLHWRIQQSMAVKIPVSVRETWADDYRRQSLRSLALQRELAFLNDRFVDWGIPAIFLKGAYLACHVYPQSGIRPLRDIDILLPVVHLRDVYVRLVGVGYQGTDIALVDFDGRDKHLPMLKSPITGIQIELHRRVSSPKHAGSDQANLDDEGVWLRKITAEVAGRRLSFFAPTDLLLHLIVHGVYDHRFDNGPLLFTDVNFLCCSADIDWELFWQMATQGGWEKGCQLVLALTERLFGAVTGLDRQLIVGVPNTCIDEAMLLSLRDFRGTRGVDLLLLPSELPVGGSRLRILWKLLFPSPENMCAIYGEKANGWRLAWLYPHRLVLRFKTWMLAIRNPLSRREARQIAHLEGWLGVAAHADQ